MRLLRFIALGLVLAAGCGGVQTMDEDGGVTDLKPAASTGDGGLLPFASPCTLDSECESGLCTKISYDRKPGPLCTYRCTPAMIPPQCAVDGCNPKGYCKIP